MRSYQQELHTPMVSEVRPRSVTNGIATVHRERDLQPVRNIIVQEY
jgi:hypothetical protein